MHMVPSSESIHITLQHTLLPNPNRVLYQMITHKRKLRLPPKLLMPKSPPRLTPHRLHIPRRKSLLPRPLQPQILLKQLRPPLILRPSILTLRLIFHTTPRLLLHLIPPRYRLHTLKVYLVSLYFL